MKFTVYNGTTVLCAVGLDDNVAVYMDECDAPTMQNEAVTFHEALRAP